MGKECVICGKPSGMYPLCREHLEQKAAGKVIKCATCGTWHYTDQPCVCETVKNSAPLNFSHPILEKISSCIICSKEANGYLFCKHCYNEYREKSILIKITNCTEIELERILDEKDEALQYICTDGHTVRSKSELAIDNYLFNHNIAHAYEKALPIDNDKKHDLHPDFYLPKLDLYIEHWGYTNKKDYLKTKEYKIEKYKNLGVTIIGTTEEDIKDIETSLTRKLKYFTPGAINE